MGGGALPTAYLAASLVATAIATWAAWSAWRGGASARKLGFGAAVAAVVLVLMVLMRDTVRRETLGAAARLDAMQVTPQWPVIALFAVLLVAGLATLAWMIVVARRAIGSGPGTPASSGGSR